MRPKFSVLLLLFLLTFGQTSYAKTKVEALARKALSENALESSRAVAELRELGPAGLNSLFQIYAEEINRQIANPLSTTAEWSRLSSALDAVSQQKDSYLSGLYWYTDFDQAREAARASGRPILSLRLLGKLNEEFSCANSRFFRTVLYPNAEVSRVLREHFVLHWESVRPVPRVTIDFGDGRKLERTITGNSIHYVLDSEGRPIDALPGLYGPQAFLDELARSEEVFGRMKGLDPAGRLRALVDYHRQSVRTTTSNWIADAEKAGGKIPESLLAKKISAGSPKAVEIAPLAVTKMSTEFTILTAITRDINALSSITDEAAWTKIALQHIRDAKLDDRSVGLIRRQTQVLLTAPDGSGLTPETKLTNLLQKFQLSIALDTVRNEYIMHTKLHGWLILNPAQAVNDLNERVYAELFLTPRSDPWLGLFSADTYTALENGGLVIH